MNDLNIQLVQQALQATGDALSGQDSSGEITILVVGGSAGMLAGLLGSSRTTADCDVMSITPPDAWEQIEIAAQKVAHAMNLPPTWLNRDCARYAWCMPIGWKARCVPVNRYGPLGVLRLSRQDLIASKIISAPKRPQDLEDLREMRPTREEIAFAAENLSRLESESLEDRSWTDERVILETFRGAK